jgi:hypothetical protein
MKKEPKNYAYWKAMMDDPEKSARFMSLGSDRQKKELKEAFQYSEYLRNLKQQDLFDPSPKR